MADLALEAIFKRDTAVVGAALLALMLLSWLALITGGRHRHGPLRHERMAAAFGRASGAELELDSRLLADRVLHVGDHDGGDDAAFGLTHGAALRARGAPGEAHWSGEERTRLRRRFRSRLSHFVESFQPLCRGPSMGA
jgi:hypothetical protein